MVIAKMQSVLCILYCSCFALSDCFLMNLVNGGFEGRIVSMQV